MIDIMGENPYSENKDPDLLEKLESSKPKNQKYNNMR